MKKITTAIVSAVVLGVTLQPAPSQADTLECPSHVVAGEPGGVAGWDPDAVAGGGCPPPPFQRLPEATCPEVVGEPAPTTEALPQQNDSLRAQVERKQDRIDSLRAKVRELRAKLKRR